MLRKALLLMVFILAINFPIFADETKTVPTMGLTAGKIIGGRPTCEALKNGDLVVSYPSPYDSFARFFSVKSGKIKDPVVGPFSFGSHNLGSDPEYYLVSVVVLPIVTIESAGITLEFSAASSEFGEISTSIIYGKGEGPGNYFPITISIGDVKIQGTMWDYSDADVVFAAQNIRKAEPIQIKGIVRLREYSSVEDLVGRLRPFRFESICEISAVGSAPTD